MTAAADAALDALRERGSPSHDGLAARMVSFAAGSAELALELQPARWALRLIPDDAARSLSVLCVVRAVGRWRGWRGAGRTGWPRGRVAGRSAPAVRSRSTRTRPTRWAASCSEEWSVEPERLSIEALVLLPGGVVLLVGQAWLPDGASVTPDHEHDEFAWWPADVGRWPEEADEPLRRMGQLLSA